MFTGLLDSWQMLPLFFLLGATIGFVGAMVGIGGGLIAIPVLGLVFGMTQQLAQGTALLMVVGNVLVAIYSYNKRNKIDFKKVAIVVITNMIATYFAALLAQMMDSNLLRDLFAVFLALIATFYIWQTTGKKTSVQREERPLTLLAYILLGFASGSIGGLFGVGGTLIVVPILTVYFCLRQTTAQGIALAMILPGLVVALFTYSYGGNVDWWIGSAMAIGGLLSVKYGVMVAYRLPEILLKRIFAGVLYATVLLILLR